MAKDYTKIINDLSRRFKDLNDSASRAAGEVSSFMKILKKEFDIDTLEEAEETLKELEKKKKDIEEILNETITKVKDILDGYEDEVSEDS